MKDQSRGVSWNRGWHPLHCGQEVVENAEIICSKWSGLTYSNFSDMYIQEIYHIKHGEKCENTHNNSTQGIYLGNTFKGKSTNMRALMPLLYSTTFIVIANNSQHHPQFLLHQTIYIYIYIYMRKQH